MTPDEQGDGQNIALTDLGVSTAEEAKEIVEKHKRREGFDRRKDQTIRDLNRRIEDLEAKKEEESLGLGDNTPEGERLLAREILTLRKEVKGLTLRAAAEPEDEELAPYLDQAMTLYPDLAKSTTDPFKRIDAFRRIARDLKAEAEGQSGATKGRSTDAAHLASGSSPVSKRSSITEEQALENYRRELAAAPKGGKEAVNAKYRAKYPEWRI